MTNTLEQLKAQVLLHLDADKVTVDKKRKQEILLLRSHVNVVDDKPDTWSAMACTAGALLMVKTRRFSVQ